MESAAGDEHGVTHMNPPGLTVDVKIENAGGDIGDLIMGMAVDGAVGTGVKGIFHTHQGIAIGQDPAHQAAAHILLGYFIVEDPAGCLDQRLLRFHPLRCGVRHDGSGFACGIMFYAPCERSLTGGIFSFTA